MGIWGEIGLSWKFAIVLGGLIVLTFLAGFIKLFVKRRRLAKNQMKQDLETARKSLARLSTKNGSFEEGDLFGVRALEKGFYGGVSQVSLSTTASTASSPRVSPLGTSSSEENSTDLSLSQSSPSETLPASSISRKNIPSPINSRLQPSYAELNGRKNHDPAIARRSYTPTSPHIPHTPRTTGGNVIEDVPQTPVSATLLSQRKQLQALLDGSLAGGHSPKLVLPQDSPVKGQLSTSNEPAESIYSEANSTAKLELPSRPDPAALKSSSLSLFPNHARREHSSISSPKPSKNKSDNVFPSSHFLPIPDTPMNSGHLSSPSVQLRATSGASVWGDSLVAELERHKRKAQVSDGAPSDGPVSKSSMSVHDDSPISGDEIIGSSRRSHSYTLYKHTRQSSSESTSSSSEPNLKQAEDSVRHSGKYNVDTVKDNTSKGSHDRSPQRDATHYGSSEHRRNKPGSIQAPRPDDSNKSIDPPLSPFDDRFVISPPTPVMTKPGISHSKSQASTSSNAKSAYIHSRFGNSTLEPEAETSVAEKITTVPMSQRSTNRLATTHDQDPDTRHGSVRTPSGNDPSRNDMMEAYYRAARMSRNYARNNSSHPAVLSDGADI